MECIVKIPNFDGPLSLLQKLYEKNELPLSCKDFILVSENFCDLVREKALTIDTEAESVLILSSLLSDLSDKIFEAERSPVKLNEIKDPEEQFLTLRKQLPFLLNGRNVENADQGTIDKGKNRSKNTDLIPLTLQNLTSSYAQIYRLKKTLEREKNEITVDERIKEIEGLMEESETFERILKKRNSRVEMKPNKEKVTTFLALLEMAKRGVVNLSQNEYRDEIKIRKNKAVFDEFYLY